MAQQRVENRLLCADVLELEWTENSGQIRVATALLEDICAVGACLHTEAEIPAAEIVELRYRGLTISAEVKYCNYRDIGFYIGVEFRDGFLWSDEQIHPQHLLDLQKLA